MHALADVALPLAVVLLLGTAVARIARRVLEPPAVACVLAAAVEAAAVLAGGDATVGSFVLPVAIGAVAILLALAPLEDAGQKPPPPPAAEPEPDREPYVPPARLWYRGDYGPGHRPAQRSP
jgi:hypothetical protein